MSAQEAPLPEGPVPHQGVGRPSKFTEATREKVLTALRMGHYRSVAAAYAGISHETLRRWLKEAENPTADAEFRGFRDSVDVAEAQAEAIDLGLIRQAARDGEWRAAAWRLERSHPDRWGKKDRSEVHVSGQIDHSVEVRVGADPISIAALARSLGERSAEAVDLGEIVDAEVVEDGPVGALLPSHGGMPPAPRQAEPVEVDRAEAPEGARDGERSAED